MGGDRDGVIQVYVVSVAAKDVGGPFNAGCEV